MIEDGGSVGSGQSSSTPRSQPLLSGSRLWSSPYLTSEERLALNAATSLFKPPTGSVDFIRERQGAGNLFILKQGWACRYATTKGGYRQIYAVLLPGDICNLDSLMLDRPEYGVRSLNEVSFVAVPRDRALALAALHPGIAQTFTWLGLVENAVLSRLVLSLGRKSALERLAHLLCELSFRLNAEMDNVGSFACPLTQENIADVLGLTSVHVNRTMQAMRRDELFKMQDRTIHIPDVLRLRRVGGFDPGYLQTAAPA